MSRYRKPQFISKEQDNEKQAQKKKRIKKI